MASSDARPLPLKNTAYRVTFPILDADGDLVTGATGLDSEVSKDGGAFADCTAEATEIATNSGMYYLDLSSTEMNADTVAVIVKTSSSGAKTTTIVLYPVEDGDIRVNLVQIASAAVSTSTAQLGVNAVQAGGTAWGSGAITAAAIATGAIDADAIADNAIDAGAIATGAITAAKFAAGAIDAAAIAANAIDASALAADAVAEIVDAVWDEDSADHLLTTPIMTTGALLYMASTDLTDQIVDAVWNEALAGHATAGSTGEALDNAGGGSSPEDIAAAVWDVDATAHSLPNSTGLWLIYAKQGTYLYSSATAAENLKKVVDGTGLSMPLVTIGAVGSVTNPVDANLINLDADSSAFDGLHALAQAVVHGAVVAGTNTTTVVSTALPSAVSGFYVGKTFIARSGANAKQGGKLVTAYDGATKRLTIETLTAAMSADDTFILVG